jgi:membrane protein DedA with SNARE-associated domain
MFSVLAIVVAHLHIREYVFHWMERYGYIGLFGVLFACGLGLPVPEDIPLVIAGVFVANGKMNLAVAAICAWCGIVGGDVVLYHLGKHFGLEVKRIPVIGRHLSEKRIDYVHRMFERWGVGVIAVGRMFAGIRGTMVVVAGTIRFTFWKFLLADGLAALVSGGLFLMLGYWFGSNERLLRMYEHEGKKWLMVACAVAAVGLGVWIYLHRQEKRSRRQKSSDLPGPPNPLPESAAE